MDTRLTVRRCIMKFLSSPLLYRWKSLCYVYFNLDFKEVEENSKTANLNLVLPGTKYTWMCKDLLTLLSAELKGASTWCCFFFLWSSSSWVFECDFFFSLGLWPDYFRSEELFVVKVASELVQLCPWFTLTKWLGVCQRGLTEISCLDLHV